MERFSSLISAAVWTNRATWITVMLLTLSVSVFAKDIEVINLNSYFEDGLENWTMLIFEGAQAEAMIDDSDSIKGSQCVYIDIKGLGTNKAFWEIRFTQENIIAEQGEQYTISVWAKADEVPRRIKPHLRYGGDQNAQIFDITTEWAEYSFTFSANQSAGVLDIPLGETEGNVWIDNFRLYEGSYQEDPDLGRTEGGRAVDRSGKLATKWGEIRSMGL